MSNTSLLDSHVTTLIQDWKDTNISTQEFIDAIKESDPTINPNATSDTIVGYSSELSAGNSDDIFVVADDNTELDYTVLANEDPFRDILVGMSVLKNDILPPIANVYGPNDPTLPTPTTPPRQGAPGVTIEDQMDNFFDLFNEMTRMVNDALNSLDSEKFRISNVNARINDIRSGHEESQRLLENTIAEIEDPDLNEVAILLSSVQQQLDASYRITARTQELSLVNFI